MMTENGFQLMRVNQLTTNKLTIEASDTPEEIGQRLSEFFNFHEEFTEQEKGEFTFELISFDTLLPGNEGKAVVLVTQKKENMYSFSMEYEVSYIVESGQLEISEIAHGNFDFGEVQKTSRRQEISAKGEFSPKIKVTDFSNASQWSVYASMSPFLNEKNQELSEASITLKDLKVIESASTSISFPKKEILLGETPQLIVSRDASENSKDEYGKTIIQIGEVENHSLTGVSLIIPANTPVDVGDYQTTIAWELVGDPTMGGKR